MSTDGETTFGATGGVGRSDGTGVLASFERFADLAAFDDGEHGDAASCVIGHQNIFAGRMNAEVRRASAAGAGAIEQLKFTIGSADREGADSAHFRFIGGEEMGAGAVDGDPRGIAIVFENAALGEIAALRIHIKAINAAAPALAAFRALRRAIGAHIGAHRLACGAKHSRSG